MKLIHMNLLESSFKKVYTMPRKALEYAKEMDALKLIGLKKQMLIKAYNWNLFYCCCYRAARGTYYKTYCGTYYNLNISSNCKHKKSEQEVDPINGIKLLHACGLRLNVRIGPILYEL